MLKAAEHLMDKESGNTMVKKHPLKLICAQVAVAAAMMGSAAPAHALCCVFDSWTITAAINSQTATLSSILTGGFTQSTMAITAAIKGAELAQASSNREAAMTVAGAVVRTQAVSDRGAQEDRYRLTNPCAVAATTTIAYGQTQASGAAVMAAGMGRGGTAMGGGGAVARPGASAAMQAALNGASGATPALAPELAAQQAVRGACETFAAPGSPRAQQCAVAGMPVGNSSGFANADVRADTLMDGPQGPTPRKRLSVDMAGPEGTAIAAYLRNINTPMLLRDLRDGEANTDEGRRYQELRNNYEARMSMGERPARNQAARMAASPANIPYVKTLLNSDDAAWVQRYLAANAPNWQTQGISADEVLNMEVYRRFTNAEWEKRMLEASPEERAREQLVIAAFQTHVLWNILRESREQGVAKGVATMAAVRQEMVPELMARHQKAAK